MAEGEEVGKEEEGELGFDLGSKSDKMCSLMEVLKHPEPQFLHP